MSTPMSHAKTYHRPAAWAILPLFLLGAFAALAIACDEDEGGGAQCHGAKTGLVTLKVADGLVFDTGVITPEAEAMTSDVVSYKSGSTVDLKSGIEVGTIDRVPFRWFRTEGGVGIVYDSLDAVPWEAPDETNLNEFLHGPEVGYAFTVQNRMSRGSYTRAYVEAYEIATGAVTLRYETVPPPCN